MVDSVVILDYGSQYTQLIARRVRELQVFSEIVAWDAPAEKVTALHPRGYILSGGPSSVYDENAPYLPEYVLKAGVPVLAYGSFITVAVNFIILAFIIFMMVRMISKLKHAEPPAPPAPTPEDTVLLREIRDALKK